jgi:hypothetical protein
MILSPVIQGKRQPLLVLVSVNQWMVYVCSVVIV